jgi:anaerobic selenocysteine-containing dehydrogenase
MVVIDPRRTETAKVADEHLFVRPGTDAFLLLAMLRTVLDEGLETVPSYVDGLDAVRRAVEPFTPERAAGITGVDADDIRRLARELAAAGSGAVYGRIGVSVQAFGLVCQWAVQVLNAVTGNLDRPGGTMFTRPAIDAVGRRLIGRGHLGLWRSRVRDLPEFGGELPVATLADEILTPGDGQVRALLTVAGNPVSSTPDGKRLGEAIAGLDFHAAIDFYVNETTRNADVILPPTSALERDHYDLVFHLLAVRNTARFTPAVYPKPAGAMHDWEIYREVALRTARRLGAKRSLRKRVSQQARMRLSPTRTIDLLLRTDASKLSLRKLAAHPDGLDLGPLQPCLPERLQTKDKRIDLAPQLVLDDLARLETSAQAELGDGELLLIGRRHQRDCNSWLHNSERLTRGKARHQLLMHPDDLVTRGIDDGSVVAVTSRVGKVEVEVAATDTMMPGVVSLPHGYGHQLDGVRLGQAEAVPGVSINDLTDPERLDVSGNAVLNGTPVTVTPISR